MTKNYSKIRSKKASPQKFESPANVPTERYHLMMTESKKNQKFDTQRRQYNKYLITELENENQIQDNISNLTRNNMLSNNSDLTSAWNETFEQDRRQKDFMRNPEFKNVVKLIN